VNRRRQSRLSAAVRLWVAWLSDRHDETATPGDRRGVGWAAWGARNGGSALVAKEALSGAIGACRGRRAGWILRVPEPDAELSSGPLPDRLRVQCGGRYCRSRDEPAHQREVGLGRGLCSASLTWQPTCSGNRCPKGRWDKGSSRLHCRRGIGLRGGREWGSGAWGLILVRRAGMRCWCGAVAALRRRFSQRASSPAGRGSDGRRHPEATPPQFELPPGRVSGGLAGGGRRGRGRPESRAGLTPNPQMQPTGRTCPALRAGAASLEDAAERKFVRAPA